MIQFRCFDVTEGPENAQIHGAATGAKELGFIKFSSTLAPNPKP